MKSFLQSTYLDDMEQEEYAHKYWTSKDSPIQCYKGRWGRAIKRLIQPHTESFIASSDVRNTGKVAGIETNLAFFILDFNTDKTLSLRTSYWEDEKTPFGPKTRLEVLQCKPSSWHNIGSQFCSRKRGTHNLKDPSRRIKPPHGHSINFIRIDC